MLHTTIFYELSIQSYWKLLINHIILSSLTHRQIRQGFLWSAVTVKCNFTSKSSSMGEHQSRHLKRKFCNHFCRIIENLLVQSVFAKAAECWQWQNVLTAWVWHHKKDVYHLYVFLSFNSLNTLLATNILVRCTFPPLSLCSTSPGVRDLLNTAYLKDQGSSLS